MSWRDNAFDEPAADLELRGELKSLLGLDPQAPARPVIAPTAESVQLADELFREALRRRHATLRPRRRTWPMLLAAGLPVALALAGTGAWGTAQKRRADALAVAVRDREAELQRMAQTSALAVAQVQEARNELVKVRQAVKPGQKARELVLPLTQAPVQSPLETQTVSNPRR